MKKSPCWAALLLFLFLWNLTPDSHEDFPKAIFSFALTDAPYSVSPCVTLDELCVAGIQELFEEVGVLRKLGLADRVHDIVLDRLPFGSQRNSAAQPHYHGHYRYKHTKNCSSSAIVNPTIIEQQFRYGVSNQDIVYFEYRHIYKYCFTAKVYVYM